MITAELRSTVVELSMAETLSGLTVEKFDKVLPLPMWREIKGEELHYGCSIANLLANQNHLDGNLLAAHWRSQILIYRRKMRSSLEGLDLVQPLQRDNLKLAQASSFTANSPLQQNGPKLYWVISKAELCRWLILNAELLVTQAEAMENPVVACGFTPPPRQCTAKREFAWYDSHNSCLRLRKQLKTALEQSAKPGEQKMDNREFKNAWEGSLREDSTLFSEERWCRLLPLLAAQLELADVMWLAPQRLVPATDHLSRAWSQWRKVQVWNNLRLSQIAEIKIVADVVYITQFLFCLSARACFKADWARPL